MDANIALINSILDGTLASTDANTLEKVQKLVDVAVKVVDLAGDVSAAKLTQAELTLIGITGVNSATKLALVNDLLVADSTAQAALSDIQTFANVAAKVITNLELATTATFDDSNALTAAELVTLGMTQDTGTPRALVSSGAATYSVNAENLGLIRLAIANAGSDADDSAVNRLSKITTLVTSTATAANKVANYADATTTPTDAGLIPTVADFEAILVTGVDSTNLSSVLDALAQSGVTVSSAIQTNVQSVVDSYNVILAAADGIDNDPTLPGESDFTRLGVTLSSHSNAAVKTAQVNVLADIVDLKTSVEVDTVAELQALADNVEALLSTAALADGTDISAQGVSVAELQALGFSGATNENIAAIRQALVNTNDDLSGVNSYGELQSLINNVINALEILANYAADETTATQVPNVATYNYATFTEVTGDNFEAVQRELIAAERDDADTTAKLQVIVDAGLAVQKAALEKIVAYSTPVATGTVVDAGDSTINANGSLNDATPRHLSMDLTSKLTTDSFTLRVGSDTLITEALATADTATLVAALEGVTGYSDLAFSVRADGEVLHIEWKDWGAYGATATLRSAQPSLDDYLLSGAQFRTNDGIDADNLYAVNKAVEGTTFTAVTASNVATVLGELETELETAGQGLGAQTAALAVIEAYADGGSTVPTVEDYTLAQVAGVTADNLVAVNTQLKALNTVTTTTHTVSDIEAAVASANTKLAAFEANTPADPQVGFTVAEYAAVGLATGISDDVANGADNLKAVNAQVALAAEGDANRVLDLNYLLAKADAAIANIEAYNNGTLGRELTVDDYAAAGITGVTPTTLYAVNNEVKFDSTLTLDSVSEIQTVVNTGLVAASDALTYTLAIAADAQSFSELSSTTSSFVPQIDNNSDPDAAGIVESNFNYSNTAYDAYKAFDSSTGTGDNNGAHSNLALNGSNTAIIGWQDTAASPTLGALQSISIVERAANNLSGRVPGEFNVEGYDPDTQTWVNIASFTNTTQGAFTVTRDQLLDKDYSAYSYPEETPYAGFRLVIHSTANQENGGTDGFVNINQITFNTKTPIDNSYAVPSLEDLNTAGLLGVSADNYPAVVEQIARTQPANAAGLQVAVGLADAAIQLLTDYEDGDTALTADDFAAAGLEGVDSYNLEFVVARLGSPDRLRR
jgi:hypothetical protein